MWILEVSYWHQDFPMKNKDIIKVLLLLLNSGRFTLHVNLAEAFQLSRPLICKPWQLSFESCGFRDKIKNSQVANCNNFAQTQVFIVGHIPLLLSYIAISVVTHECLPSKKTNANIPRFSHLEIPSKYQYLTGIPILILMGRFYDTILDIDYSYP